VLLKTEEALQLQSVQQVNCLEMMDQLSWLVRWSSEIFNNLLKNSEETAQRITNVKKRVEKLKDKVPEVESLFMEQNPTYFYDNPYTGKRWKRKEKKLDMKILLPFSRSNAPEDVNRLRMDAMPLPDLKEMDKYQDEDDKKIYKSCIKKYSMPEFFENEWVKKEKRRVAKLRAERKQRRRKKKRHGKAKRVIEGVTKKKYNAMGETSEEKGTKTILEGDKMEFEDEDYDERRRTTVTEPTSKMIIRRRSTEEKTQAAPPPVSTIKPKAMSIPEDTPVVPPPPQPPANPTMVPPPQPAPIGGGADEPSAADAIPEEMQQFIRMYNIMKNPYAVINRMKKVGYTEQDFQKWIDPTHVIEAPKRRSKSKKKPVVAKKPPARPNPMGGGGGGMNNVLAGIRAGANLKKAGERQIKQLPKPKPDQKTQLLNAIQKGTKLKKVDRSPRKKKESKEVEDAMENNPVMALLRLREKMAMTDSEDSSDESTSDSEWED